MRISTRKMVNGGTSAHYYESKYMSPNHQKFDITCDRITFNPLEETITILACDFKDEGHNEKTRSKIIKLPTEKNAESVPDGYQKIDNTIKPNCQPCWVKDYDKANVSNYNERVFENDPWQVQGEIVDIICLGVIVMLILIWLTVFVYYEVFYEFPDAHNNIDLYSSNVYTDDSYDRK